MFMIFDGNHAVNLDLVTSMSQDDERGIVTINFNTGSSVLVKATIDQILTAQAAGQSRVLKPDDELNPFQKAAVDHVQKQSGQQYDRVARTAFDDGSKRGQSTGNDKQAMNSIGRKS